VPTPPSFAEKGVGVLGIWLLFLIFLGLWTWKLLEPNPLPEALEEGIPTDWKFILAKSLHASAYAFLTVLASWLPLRRLYFWVAVGTLMRHGVGTEIGQYVMDVGRHGCVRDVLIDWFGIGMGLVFLRIIRPSSAALPTPPP
jgi:hypothetical protein